MGKLSKKVGRKKEVESQKEMTSKVALFGKISK